MKIGNESTSEHDLDICGISLSSSQTKLPNQSNNSEDKTQKNETTKKNIQTIKDRDDLQGSVSLNDLNILGLKDYYLGSNDNLLETKSKLNQDNIESPGMDFQQNEQLNTKLDQLGFKLNEVIGHYLNELTNQPRLSFDSFPLQNSENLDEEQQQQILDYELQAMRQRIYRQIVDKINLSVIQSVSSFGSSCQLPSQSNIIQAAFSKELINSTTHISQISSISPRKSISHSILDQQLQIHQSIHCIQPKTNKNIEDSAIQMTENEKTKEDLQNKLKMSLCLNQKQHYFNNQLKEELSKLEKRNSISDNNNEDKDHNNLYIENQRLREENLKLIEFIEKKLCDQCKTIPKDF
ncbi:unnamed protein product (macronuclear) [Paramecium tetraurelia]|uniref:Uncharacterized protein n=1 Tax=Paramecium tetraurelia TaxID=5888 RepID=A0DNG4_PARTE|nr:uncharacterized protein GSPATT00018777001 [Paramecium tetraurelia]CAK84581.1 unnamed protein product [Paramecium tetraurelia]|eukprot:XP_001451978.1 hypothetical protein (macronuclear) [Paramecium tetraurelia strain d4-2]